MNKKPHLRELIEILKQTKKYLYFNQNLKTSIKVKQLSSICMYYICIIHHIISLATC